MGGDKACPALRMTAELSTPKGLPDADAYLAKAFRSVVADEPLVPVLSEIVEAARAQSKCVAAVLVRCSGARRHEGSRIGAGDADAFDGVPSLTLPVLVNGRATHVLDLFAGDLGHRFDQVDIEWAWRYAALAGLVLAGTQIQISSGVRNEQDESGIVARHGFEEDVAKALQEHNGRVGVIIVRACDLGEVNQRWGREVGDEVLRLIARAMLDAIGGAGTVGRLRRHEFGAVVPAADYVETDAIADRIRDVITSPLPVLGVPDVWAQIAVGVAATGGGTTTSVVPILHATYRAVDEDERQPRRRPRSSRFGF